MKVIGLDPSCVSTGVVVLETQAKRRPMRWSERALVVSGHTGIERACVQVAELDEILVSTRPEFGVIEGYAYGNKFTLAHLVEVGTCMRLALRRRGIPYVVVQPSMLKRFVGASKTGLRGKALKDAVRTRVESLYGYLHECDDVVEAFALAMFGLVLRRGADAITAAQLELVGEFARALTEPDEPGRNPRTRKIRAESPETGDEDGLPDADPGLDSAPE